MKQKVRKSAARRFRITPTGKVLRRRSFGRHLRHTKSGSQKRRFRQTTAVTGPISRRIKRLMARA